MKIYKRLLIITLVFLFFTSCDKNNNVPVTPDPVPTEPKPAYIQTANVYVAGQTYDSVTYVRHAAYWKNGTPVILDRGTRDSGANAIAVVGDDVYTAGYVYNEKNSFDAVYWKNGVRINLGSGVNASSASSIAINGNDVYIAGFEGSSAGYWKNGMRVNLPLLPGMTIGSSSGIGIQGTDIYVTGYQIGTKATAVYWKNEVPKRLQNDSVSYAGKNILFHNNQMYIPITYQQLYAKNNVINYWKNDTPVSLGDGKTGLLAIQMAASGDDLYVACLTSKGPGYFKNGVLTTFSDRASELTGIAVLNGDVYASTQSLYQGKSVAAFWKNGVPVYLSSSLGRDGFASSIVVTPL